MYCDICFIKLLLKVDMIEEERHIHRYLLWCQDFAISFPDVFIYLPSTFFGTIDWKCFQDLLLSCTRLSQIQFHLREYFFVPYIRRTMSTNFRDFVWSTNGLSLFLFSLWFSNLQKAVVWFLVYHCDYLLILSWIFMSYMVQDTDLYYFATTDSMCRLLDDRRLPELIKVIISRYSDFIDPSWY